MSFRRALVDCAVLSLQDAGVFYPCCRECFSRIDVEQQDATRCRCFKCGYRCLRKQVDYRYRLSLRVARDGCIFGITVFGNSLIPFFGIHASGLQKLVENSDGTINNIDPSTRLTLLVKAVEDCFIGRHFIFGLKVMETESGPWFGGPVLNVPNSKNAVQFVATQMILPNATGLRGCTVLSYYQSLLQKTSESELGSADPRKTSRLAAKALLLIPDGAPASSFGNDTLPASGLLSQPVQRSQHKDCTLTPTPPWQQSLGLVTSSAEQDEGCSTQESGDEHCSQTEKSPPHPAQRGCLENHKATEDRINLSLQHSFYGSPSFAKYSTTSIKKEVGSSPGLNTFFSPSQSLQKRCLPEAKEFSTGQLTRTFLSSSWAWEDLPFSESLTEFIREENKDFDSNSETKQIKILHRKEETARNLASLTSETPSACHRTTQIITDSHSQMLLDISNALKPNGCDRPDISSLDCKNHVQCVNRSQARKIYSHESNQEDEEASSLFFQKEEEQQLEGDTYNCSADLFGSSVMITMDTERLSMHTEAIRIATEACPQLSKPDEQLSYQNANVTQSTPNKLTVKRRECRESVIPQDTQDFDFVPPSQSTPIVKVGAALQSPTLYKQLTGEFNAQLHNQDFGVFYANLHEIDSKTTSVVCKLNSGKVNQAFQGGRESIKENLVWRTTSSRCSHRFTPKRRFWKPVKNHLHSQQPLRVQRGVLSLMSTGTINSKCDSRVSDVTESDYEDNEVIVPPTPAGKMQLSVPLRRRKLTDNSNSLASTMEVQQGDEINCNTMLRDHTLTSLHRGLTLTENCDSETVSEGILDRENQTCDWSRDLFSDSF